MISFIFPLLYILLANATTTCIVKKNFTKSLPITLLLIPFPLFFSGLLFSTFKIGIIINILYALSSIFIIINNFKNKKWISEFKSNYFTHGLIGFLVIYVFIFIYDLNRVFYAWDETSHWGLMLKEMFRLDNFYSINESNLLVHKDYPPILQLFEFFWMKCSLGFKECYATRALHTFELSLILPFLKLDKPIKNLSIDELSEIEFSIIKTIGMIFIILLTFLLFDTHIILNSIYNDYPLSILITYIVLLILFEKDKTSNYLLINISLLLSFILLTKQVALAFYIMIIFFYLIMLIGNKKITKKEIVKIIILFIIIPLSLLLIWNNYIDAFNIEKQFMISDIKLYDLKDVISNSSNAKNVIVKKFITAIFNEKISYFNIIDLTYFNSFILFSMITLTCYVLFKEIKKIDLLKYYFTLTIGHVGYAVMMLILYIFCFKEEGFTLASFDRYMNTYLLILFISILIIIINHAQIKNNSKYYVFIILILLFTIEGSILQRIVPKLKQRDITSVEIVSNYISDKTDENAKIFVLSQETKHAGVQLLINYYASPRSMNFMYYNFPTDCDDCEKSFNYNIKNYFLEYDYFYIASKTDELYEKYSFMLENVQPFQLYKIVNKDNKISFEIVK